MLGEKPLVFIRHTGIANLSYVRMVFALFAIKYAPSKVSTFWGAYHISGGSVGKGFFNKSFSSIVTSKLSKHLHHILGKNPQGFLAKAILALVFDIPIGAADDGHFGIREVFVEPVKRSTCARPPTGSNRRRGLPCEKLSVKSACIKDAVKQGAERTVRTCEIHGRTDDHAVCLNDFLNQSIARIVIKRTSVCIFTTAAMDTTMHGICSKLKILAFNAIIS